MKSVHRTVPLLTLLTSLSLSGCLGSDDGGGSATSSGQLNYNGFSGLSFSTASQSGTTGADGEFRYYPGETVSFRVGDLVLADNVPARRHVTLLELFPGIRSALQTPTVDAEGLRTHTGTELNLLENASLMNMTRLLMLLDWTQGVPEGEGIEIRQRVIDQLNAALPLLDSPIDFNVPTTEFTATGTTPSPANQLLARICFHPEGDELCEPPPTPEQIQNAPERPENEADWDPETEYRQDLQAKRDRILEAIRTMDEIDNEDARTYLRRELKDITTAVSNRYYLDEDVASHPASDTGIKSVRVKRIGGPIELSAIEAISTRPEDVTIHAWSWQSAEVDYFVSGSSGGESELVMSFRPENTYRWIRKSLRVIIR
ncbi:organic solvent ABC transporter permease [Marinobacter pelagius]|uniref:organic solvent ABC transporter permease n=1 Tax=Marinobacter sp. C7 TaxID=2951363 RepID=UPI001EEFA4B2|nr:organic solvent ABC transporter permease [Marinobacter sp. C7]MCG7199838.1 organic solvent ABC transporter permease [Marinobacter sp. C7]